jgi:hypothetical protein
MVVMVRFGVFFPFERSPDGLYFLNGMLLFRHSNKGGEVDKKKVQ